jgi:adenosylcobinamide-phosphate synthase
MCSFFLCVLCALCVKVFMTRSILLLIAILLDWLFGEPPNQFHPVAWYGSVMQRIIQRAPQKNLREQLVYGAGIVLSGIAIAGLPALILEKLAARKTIFALAAALFLLKTMFAQRALLEAGNRVYNALARNDLAGARCALGSLVSRDTSQLGESLMAAAAIESLAENASDSFVAPLFYYALWGLPGACIYRAVNTLDAMIGYHGRYEYLGKVAARLDDVLNFFPARLTALLIVAAARITGEDGKRAWQIAQHDHAVTASPNAGYPMSAIAGGLDVRLEKVGHYGLNEHGRAPEANEILRAQRVVAYAMALGAFLTIGVIFARSDE